MIKKKLEIGIQCLLTCTTFQAFSQNYITNPGFEGKDGIEVIPADWFAGCGVMNTPDTQPGWWNVENKPAEGKSYIDLLYKEDGTTESVYQKLQTPLDSGACYKIEIYLSQACQDSISNLFPYDLNHPGDLTIRGSETYGCNNGQTCAFFETVSNCHWKKYTAVFHANETINYIYLEFNKGDNDFKNGSILIDDFKLENLFPLTDRITESAYSSTVTLTPLVDGINHEWFYEGALVASDTSSISVLLNHNQIIELSYYTADGCLVNETFVLYVKPEIPNVLTANDDDNINHVFYIKGLIETCSLSILNRWGEVVFYDELYNNNWTPENLNDGVYFYSLYLKETGRTFQGFVTIF